MDNSSRRGFFGQLFAGLTGCIFFPFFKKEPNDHVPIWLTSNERLIDKNNQTTENTIEKILDNKVKIIPITFTYCDLNGKIYSQHNGFAKMYIDNKNISGFQIIYEKNLV